MIVPAAVVLAGGMIVMGLLLNFGLDKLGQHINIAAGRLAQGKKEKT